MLTHLPQTPWIGGQLSDGRGQPLGRKLGLRDHHAGTRTLQMPSVGSLMAGGSMREWDQNGRKAAGGQLRNRHGTATCDDQIADGVRRSHLINVRSKVYLDGQPGTRPLESIEIRGAGLPQKPHFFRPQQGKPYQDSLVDRHGALATTGYQDREAAFIGREIQAAKRFRAAHETEAEPKGIARDGDIAMSVQKPERISR